MTNRCQAGDKFHRFLHSNFILHLPDIFFELNSCEMKRRKIVAGNWKMNKTFDEGTDLLKAIIEKTGKNNALAIVCPPFIHLSNFSKIIKKKKNLKLGAQNCHQVTSGAYTGEVSAPMLKSCGVEFVILGHSERREYFGEEESLLAKKVDTVLSSELQPIFCVGEKLEFREANQQAEVVKKQLEGGLFHLDLENFSKVVVAYEPVWAIGTGKTASPAQAQEMHAFIRKLIEKKYGRKAANATSILYGGSCNAANAAELFSQKDVDGGLIGGAALKADDFITILNSF
jgi:triosephosphate isomerase (TIM)